MNEHEILLTILSGLLSNRSMTWLKSYLLNQSWGENVTGGLADIIAWVIAILWGYAIVTGVDLSSLEISNPDMVIVGSLIASKLWFEGQKLIRVLQRIALIMGLKNGK